MKCYEARVSLYVSLVSVGLGITLGAFVGVISAFQAALSFLGVGTPPNVPS